MKQPSSWAAAHVTPLFVLLVTIAVLMIGASDAWAFGQYSQDKDATNCRACHGDFRDPYTSPIGVMWGDDLHDVHRNDMLSGDCNTCHSAGPFFPVLLDSSTGGAGLAAISCVGCHGRDEDGGNDSVSGGLGAGLRQHHWTAGVEGCAGCHSDANPENYMPVGEDVLPEYYANPGSNHPSIPSDACNANFEEGAFGGNLALGLDNDGDNIYDTGDPDCTPGCTINADCDNGEFCDGSETCDVGTGECVAGTPVNVDDGVGCTDDSCDEANDVVVNFPLDALCDNGAFCDGSETCDAVTDCQAGTPPCDPGTETCDEAGDVCEAIGCQSDAECDNGAFCDGTETCNTGTGECMPGTPVNVDDGVSCTDDSCDEANDEVVNVPNDGLCDNGDFCDGSETCDAVNDCQAGTPVNVDDGVGCTDDSCDEANDVVVNFPLDALCDNGMFCDGSETCDAVTDCQAGTPPCDPATETCDEAGDVCEAIGCQSDAECDDAAFCNGAESCNLDTGQCVPGTPVDADDGVSCTDDSCDEANDMVVNVPNDGLCDNGMFCDGSETCDAVNDCQAGAPVNVDDGVGCTDDSCDEANDMVVNVPNDGLCDNGMFCDGSETCDAVTDCQAGTPPCDPGTETCDEAGDVCEAIGCQSDAECDDAAFCNGAESCNLDTGQCVPGTPVDADDGVSCTDDSCDEANDMVVNVPNDGLCDNGMFCDGSETCDAVNDCQAGAPVNVDDGVGCTDDSCDEANDMVVNVPNDGLCDNGMFCDGSETCDAVTDCQAGTPPCDSATETCNEDGDVCEAIGCQSDAECDDAAFCNGAESCNLDTGQCVPGTPVDADDGVSCTDDSCDEANDMVVNVPNDGLCDNGMFCDGSETCDAVNDCQAGAPVNVDDGVGCTDDSCDEANDMVVNAPNDGLCDNGLFCDGSETCDAVDDCQAGTPPCDPDTQTCNEDANSCEGDMFQVAICHKPGDRSEQTLLVDPPAVRAHLRHGDLLGPCNG